MAASISSQRQILSSMQDPYWQAVIDALQRAPELVTVGPAELKPFVPGLLSFAEARAVPQQIVCHKGLVSGLPAGLLAACIGRTRVVFANEVFVIFEVSETADPHVRALEVELGRQFFEQAALAGPILRRPVLNRRASAPRVVAALQSPTLLNVWGKAPAWRLEVAELGDHEGLAETTLLDVPRWDGRADGVAAILLTTPAQLDRAEREMPAAAKLWVIHQGSPNLLPLQLLPRVHGIVTLSRKVLDIQRSLHREHLSKPAWVVPPAYEPVPSHGWKKGIAWMMMSRPESRRESHLNMISQTAALIEMQGGNLTIYGQGHPAGFLDTKAKAALYRACSCYVSPLPPWAGFGLAQHECFASGVPVAGLWWGDLREEMSPDYAGLADSLDGLADQVVRISNDEAFARRLSELGLDYIATCRTARNMNEAVERLVNEIQGP